MAKVKEAAAELVAKARASPEGLISKTIASLPPDAAAALMVRAIVADPHTGQSFDCL
jgi:hypothetical protein